MERRNWLAGVLTALVLALPDPGRAQATGDVAVLQGSVSDYDTGSMIQGASLTLTSVDEDGESVGPILTNEQGNFVFRDVPPGNYVLRTSMLGFHPRQDSLALDRGTEVRVALELAVSPVPLDPLVVEVVFRPSYNMENFDARRARLHGRFFDREAIEERFPLRISDLYQTVPSVVVGPGGNPVSRRGGAGSFSPFCPMAVYVDGVATSGVDQMMSPDMIEAMEVYTSVAQVPVQYRTNACGVVLIWSRGGVRPEPGMERRPGTLWKGILAVAGATGLLWAVSR